MLAVAALVGITVLGSQRSQGSTPAGSDYGIDVASGYCRKETCGSLVVNKSEVGTRNGIRDTGNNLVQQNNQLRNLVVSQSSFGSIRFGYSRERESSSVGRRPIARIVGNYLARVGWETVSRNRSVVTVRKHYRWSRHRLESLDHECN